MLGCYMFDSPDRLLDLRPAFHLTSGINQRDLRAGIVDPFLCELNQKIIFLGKDRDDYSVGLLKSLVDPHTHRYLTGADDASCPFVEREIFKQVLLSCYLVQDPVWADDSGRESQNLPQQASFKDGLSYTDQQQVIVSFVGDLCDIFSYVRRGLEERGNLLLKLLGFVDDGRKALPFVGGFIKIIQLIHWAQMHGCNSSIVLQFSDQAVCEPYQRPASLRMAKGDQDAVVAPLDYLLGDEGRFGAEGPVDQIQSWACHEGGDQGHDDHHRKDLRGEYS